MSEDISSCEPPRAALIALAFRMLGDIARAEQVVHEAQLRWQGRAVDVRAPKTLLLKIVTRLCLKQLASAPMRREGGHRDGLQKPLDLEETGLGRVEMMDQISMAFLVLLHGLTPAERAVLLLHSGFDPSHTEVTAPLQKS